MVEPLDTQNMISRAPMVEKTVASHRENAPQVQYQMDHIQKDRQHLDENVQLHRESVKTESEADRERKPPQQKAKGENEKPAAETSTVEWVQETAEEPPHQLDVEI
jgi:hypothetical protein